MSGQPQTAAPETAESNRVGAQDSLFSALLRELEIEDEHQAQALADAILALDSELPGFHPKLNILAEAAAQPLPTLPSPATRSQASELLLRGISGYPEVHHCDHDPTSCPAMALLVLGCLSRVDASFRIKIGREVLMHLARMVVAKTSRNIKKALSNATYVWNRRPEKNAKTFITALLDEIRSGLPDHVPSFESLEEEWLPPTASDFRLTRIRAPRIKNATGRRRRSKRGDNRYRRRLRRLTPPVDDTNSLTAHHDPSKYDRPQGDDGSFEDGVRLDGAITTLPKPSAKDVTDEDIEYAREAAYRTFAQPFSTQHPSTLSLVEAQAKGAIHLALLDANLKNEKTLEAYFDFAALLIVAVGGDFREAQAVRFIDGESVLEPGTLHLGKGLYIRSAVKPKRTVPIRLGHLTYDKSTQLSRLPLPPRFVAACRKLHAHDPGAIARGVLKAADKKTFNRYLKSSSDLAPISNSASRLKHVLRARSYEHFQDMTATMQICGDTWWKSTTSLHYVAPLSEYVAKIYRAAMWPVFGDDPSSAPPLEDGDLRIGQPAIVTMETAAALVRSFSRRWKKNDLDAIENLSDRGKRLTILHNAYMSQVAEHLRHICQHRPTNALFRLTRYDFDLLGHLVLPSDKRIDPAHWYRISSTTELGSKSLGYYLEHLKVLADRPELPAATRQHVLEVIEGKKPLFFHLRPDLSIGATTMKLYKRLIETAWKGLPDNWNRSYFANHIREEAAESGSALAADIQLGQLELTDNPTSPTSGIAPVQWCSAVRPAIEKHEALLGWRAKQGLGERLHDPAADLPPLTDYSFMEVEHAALMAKVVARHTRNTSAKAASNSKNGWKALSQALSEIRPDFLVYLRSTTLAQHLPKDAAPISSPTTSKTLSEDDVMRIEATLDLITNKQAVLGAALNAFLKCARHAARKGGWEISTPSLWCDRKSPEATAFFSGMMLPRMTVLALRSLAIRIPALIQSDAELPCFHKALAKAALFVGLFTNVNSEEDVTAILLAEDAAFSAVPNVPDATLAYISRGKRRVSFILRGIAHVSVGALRRQYASELAQLRVNPDANVVERINQDITTLFEEVDRRLLGAPERFLQNLCSAVRINHLVEQSPACLAAYGADGSWSTSPESAKAFLFNANRDAGTVAASHSARRAPRLFRSNAEDFVQEEAAFRSIQDALVQGDEDLRTYHVRAAQELRGLFPEPRGSASYWIAQFTLSLIESTGRGRNRKGKLAPAALQKFVGCFGQDLIDGLYQAHQAPDLSARNGDELFLVYKAILDNRSRVGDASLAARQLLDFHRMLVRALSVAPIAEDHFSAYLKKPDSNPDAEVVTDNEVFKTVDELTATLDHADKTLGDLSVFEYWVVAAARVILILLWATGARISEICSLRVGDVIRVDGAVVGLLLRRSRFRELKSLFGRRIVFFDGPLLSAHQAFLNDWLKRLQLIHGASFNEKTLLFDAETVPAIKLLGANVRNAIYDASLRALGFTLKLHRTRHSFACKRILKAAPASLFETTMATALQGNLGAVCWSSLMRRLQALRDVAVSIGHSSLLMTLGQYCHFPWILVNGSAALEAGALVASSLARAANQAGHTHIDAYGVHPLKDARVPSPANQPKTVAHRHYERMSSFIVRTSTTPPDTAPSAQSEPPIRIRRRSRTQLIPPADLYKLLWNCIRSPSPMETLKGSAIPLPLRVRIAKAIQDLRKTPCGYDLFNESRRPRELEAGVDFGKLCKALVQYPQWIPDFEEVCNAFTASSKSHRIQGLSLEPGAAELLRELLITRLKLIPSNQFSTHRRDSRVVCAIHRSDKALSEDVTPENNNGGRAQGMTLTAVFCVALVTCWIWLSITREERLKARETNPRTGDCASRRPGNT